MSSDAPRWTGFPGIERAVVRTLVSELLDGAATLPPAEVFTAVCDVMVSHFSLTNARLFTRIGGQSRAFVWSGSGATSSRLAREQEDAVVLECASQLPEEGETATSALVSDEQLGLSARLYVQSCRPLDGDDRALLEDVLRRMLCLPSAPSAEEM